VFITLYIHVHPFCKYFVDNNIYIRSVNTIVVCAILLFPFSYHLYVIQRIDSTFTSTWYVLTVTFDYYCPGGGVAH
jgi:hypothetical protein